MLHVHYTRGIIPGELVILRAVIKMSNKRLIYGFHALNVRLWQNPKSLCEIYVMSERHDARARAVLDKAAVEGIKTCIVDKERINKLTGNARHQGVAAWIDASCVFVSLDDVLDYITEPPLLLVLDGVTDPHNLGACLRAADAMGAHAVIAPKDRAVSLNATVSKVACGAAEVVPYITVTNLARTLRELKERGMWIAGTTTVDADVDLFHAKLPGPLAWVLGSEGEGLRRLTRVQCDILVSIPMLGVVESLNVSVSSGIVLAESRRQRASVMAES